jgi:hypothetical protein
MELTYLFGDITKTEKTDDGLVVNGKATGPDLDIDKQICDPGWLEKAMPAWMEWGNIREGHSPLAAGVGLELAQEGSDWHLKSLCVDPTTQRKLETGVLKGYSIGIKGARVVKDGQAPGGRIVGGEIVEISYVDRPANPTAKITVAKSAGGGADLGPVDEAGETVQADVVKRDFSDKERSDMAASGEAMPGGGFPIPDVAALKDAIRAIGRAKDPAAAKAHIKKRAAALGKTDLIPDSWKAADADTTKGNDDEWTHDPQMLAQVRNGLAQLMQAELDELMNGEPEVWDLQDLLCSLQTFLSWWCDEAYEGETPAPNADLDDQGDVTMDLTSLGVSADTVKAAQADDATDEQKAAPIAELRKALGLEDVATKAVVADTVKEAVADAIKGVEERLATVETMAAPGGAARTRSQQDTAKAAAVDRLTSEADRYRQLASTVTDPTLASGYRAKAAELDRELAGITPTA